MGKYGMHATSRQQSEVLRLEKDISFGLESKFAFIGKRLLLATTEEQVRATKEEAHASVKKLVTMWRQTKGREAVTRALASLHLSELDS